MQRRLPLMHLLAKMRKRKQTLRQESSKHNSAKDFEYGKPKKGSVIEHLRPNRRKNTELTIASIFSHLQTHGATLVILPL